MMLNWPIWRRAVDNNNMMWCVCVCLYAGMTMSQSAKAFEQALGGEK